MERVVWLLPLWSHRFLYIFGLPRRLGKKLAALIAELQAADSEIVL